MLPASERPWDIGDQDILRHRLQAISNAYLKAQGSRSWAVALFDHLESTIPDAKNEWIKEVICSILSLKPGTFDAHLARIRMVLRGMKPDSKDSASRSTAKSLCKYSIQNDIYPTLSLLTQEEEGKARLKPPISFKKRVASRSYSDDCDMAVKQAGVILPADGASYTIPTKLGFEELERLVNQSIVTTFVLHPRQVLEHHKAIQHLIGMVFAPDSNEYNYLTTIRELTQLRAELEIASPAEFIHILRNITGIGTRIDCQIRNSNHAQKARAYHHMVEMIFRRVVGNISNMDKVHFVECSTILSQVDLDIMKEWAPYHALWAATNRIKLGIAAGNRDLIKDNDRFVNEEADRLGSDHPVESAMAFLTLAEEASLKPRNDFDEAERCIRIAKEMTRGPYPLMHSIAVLAEAEIINRRFGGNASEHVASLLTLLLRDSQSQYLKYRVMKKARKMGIQLLDPPGYAPAASSERRIALWLLPEPSAGRRIKEHIQALSRTYGVPPFEPHITLFGPVIEKPERVASDTRELAKQLPAMNLSLDGARHYYDWTKWFHHPLLPSKELNAAREAALKKFHYCHFSMPDQAWMGFYPHLSLAYGPSASPADLWKEFKEAPPVASFTVDRLALYATEEPVASWELIASGKLKKR